MRLGTLEALRLLHLAALVLWLLCPLLYGVRVARARRRGEEAERDARRRAHGLLVLEHVGFLTLLLSGLFLARLAGLAPGRARWYDLKLGLVLFLLIPLEAIHAYVAHVWIARGLGKSDGKDLARGSGVQEMLLALAVPLLGLAIPLLLWLSLARPR